MRNRFGSNLQEKKEKGELQCDYVHSMNAEFPVVNPKGSFKKLYVLFHYNG
jgi:hypothetical protein